MHRSKLMPEARRDAVYAGLRAAFGSSMVGEFQPIMGGVSGALIVRFDLWDRPHVLRLEPERIARDDCACGYACMAAAAGVGGQRRACEQRRYDAEVSRRSAGSGLPDKARAWGP